MDSVTRRISEIERTANAIVEHAETKKRALELEMQARRDEFDAELEAKTQAKIIKIRVEVQRKMDRLLEEQEEENKTAIEVLKKDFERHHKEYAKEILGRMIEL